MGRVAIHLAAGWFLISCAGGESPPSAATIPDRAAAINRALALTVLEEPIEVVQVQQGRAGELVWTPGGLYPNEQEAARERAKRQRLAWAVTLIGQYPVDCLGADRCPLIETQHKMAIDVQTGEILLQVLGGDIER